MAAFHNMIKNLKSGHQLRPFAMSIKIGFTENSKYFNKMMPWRDLNSRENFQKITKSASPNNIFSFSSKMSKTST